MKTTVKKEWEGKVTPYTLDFLENEAEIQALIKEAEVTLKPCAHCGKKRAYIVYLYTQGDQYPKRVDTENNKVILTEHPHALYVECPDCNIRTKDWHAEDNEEDFKEALQLITKTWNKRPE